MAAAPVAPALPGSGNDFAVRSRPAGNKDNEPPGCQTHL